MTHIETGEILRSRAPANKFLHEDDLEIFKNIHGEKFLSVPWKGTVIGVATDNYPILTKAGTITMGNELNQRLAGADCEGLLKIAKEYSVKYMYFPHLSCDRLRKLAKSREGMYLYEVEK